MAWFRQPERLSSTDHFEWSEFRSAAPLLMIASAEGATPRAQKS
jgi:hypothetical protein